MERITGLQELQKAQIGLYSDGFGCKCSSDVVVEPAYVLHAARTNGNDVGAKRGSNVRHVGILETRCV